MAQKKVGYVELEWICPTCKTRNPGSSRTCQGCGAPQPPDVKFVAPAQAQVIKDEAVIAQATAGVDIHCPYCDARNPAGAKVCHQCGGDLTKAQARQSGQLVADFNTNGPATVKCPTCGTENPSNLRQCKNCGAPLPVAKPAPLPVAQPKPSGGNSCLFIVIGVALIFVVGIFLFFMFSGPTKTTQSVGKVVNNHWVRTIEIMALRPRQYTAWLDEVPADATLGACTDEVREEVDEPTANSREVCGTPYAVDQGNGFAQEVQDCVYQVIEQQCKYTVNEWQPIDVATSEGSGISANWPSLAAQTREGDRDEEYSCVITANDQQYVYKMSSFAEFQKCVVGSSWNIVTTESGQVVSASPAE